MLLQRNAHSLVSHAGSASRQQDTAYTHLVHDVWQACAVDAVMVQLFCQPSILLCTKDTKDASRISRHSRGNLVPGSASMDAS